MDAQLVTFEGIAGSGKSTLSEYIAIQYQLNGRTVHWLDEYELGATVFSDVFDAFQRGDADLVERLDVAWQRLLIRIEQTPAIYVSDGIFSTWTLWLLVAANLPREEVTACLTRIGRLVAVLKPRVVHLAGDAEPLLHRASMKRGMKWTDNFVAMINSVPYQQHHQRSGLAGVITFFRDTDNWLTEFLATQGLHVLSVDTTEGDWVAYRQRILDYVDCPEVAIEGYNVEPMVLGVYTGRYSAPTHSGASGQLIIALSNDMLMLTTPDIEGLKLVPETDTRFHVQGTRMNIEFVVDAGTVMSLLYTAPDGQTYLHRKMSDIE